MFALNSIRRIAKFLPEAVKDGNNLQAREEMAWASTQAGMVESTSCCISEHSMEHALSAFLSGLPHGAGLVALSVPYFTHLLKKDEKKVAPRYMDMARAMGEENVNSPSAFITALKKLIKNVGLEGLKLSDWGLRKDDAEKTGRKFVCGNGRAVSAGSGRTDPRRCLRNYQRSHPIAVNLFSRAVSGWKQPFLLENLHSCSKIGPLNNKKQRRKKLMSKILITSALPYVNGVPHLGHMVGCLLPSDVYARFMRMSGHEVLYIGGTDEHGTPSEVGAAKEGMSVEAYCDKYHARHKKTYDDFELSFDCFGRSSSEQNRELVYHIFDRLDKNGFIEERAIKQLYSIDDERFLPDRYVTGTCPHCGYEKARGDQCENCTKVLEPTDLINPRSTISGSTNLEVRETRHLFLKLPLIEKKTGSLGQVKGAFLAGHGLFDCAEMAEGRFAGALHYPRFEMGGFRLTAPDLRTRFFTSGLMRPSVISA